MERKLKITNRAMRPNINYIDGTYYLFYEKTKTPIENLFAVFCGSWKSEIYCTESVDLKSWSKPYLVLGNTMDYEVDENGQSLSNPFLMNIDGKNRLYYSCLTNIGIAYENIRKRMLLQDAVIRLNNIWSYDMLTQLYNRAGFYYEARTILELFKMQNSKIFVLFSDADGLKKVNDTLGHDAGDTLIKEMAMCFQENLSSDMLAMRYGGDEFVVFGSYEDEIEITCLLEGIKASMERRNVSGNYPFQFSASIGVTTYNAADVEELSEVIELADARMYEQKRKKREKNKI